MADAEGLAARAIDRNLGRHRTATQPGGENLDHHGQSGSLVATDRSGRSALRCIRGGRRPAGGIEKPPAQRDIRLPEVRRVGEFAQSHGGRRHVEKPAAASARARHCDTERVGPKDRGPSLPGSHRRATIAHHDADQPGARELLPPPGTGSEMIGVAGHHNGKTEHPREAEGVIRAAFGDHLAKAVFAVLPQTDAVLPDHAADRRHVKAPRAQLLKVGREHLDSVRIHAAQVRGD